METYYMYHLNSDYCIRPGEVERTIIGGRPGKVAGVGNGCTPVKVADGTEAATVLVAPPFRNSRIGGTFVIRGDPATIRKGIQEVLLQQVALFELPLRWWHGKSAIFPFYQGSNKGFSHLHPKSWSSFAVISA